MMLHTHWSAVVSGEGRVQSPDSLGSKDRMTMLPGTFKADLSKHIERARALDQRDLRQGVGRVELPRADCFLKMVRRPSTMKTVFCGLASVGLFLFINGQARADYFFTTIDVP